MDAQQTLQMLRSPSLESRKNVIRYLLRHGLRDSEADVRVTLTDLFSDMNEFTADLREVLLRNPLPEFVPLFQQLLRNGSNMERQRSLECLELWLRSGVIAAEQVYDSLVACSRSDSPWLRALASVQIARHLEGGSQSWREVAAAIAAADQGEWWRSMRSQVEELLQPGEVNEVNRELDNLGVGRLRLARSETPE
jgi:hypothetical protein